MPVPIDLSGQRFGRLVVLRPNTDHPTRRAWWCRCDCGAETSATTKTLRNGDTRSCGCIRREQIAQRNFRHGHRQTGTWTSWQAMRRRCEEPALRAYRNYGGRGIKVCDRWSSFENFLADMGERPPGKTLDRIDANGNYEPGNCRWATKKEQCRNQRKSRFITANGETKTMAEWAETTGLSPTTIHRRLQVGLGQQEAVAIPAQSPHQMARARERLRTA